MPELLCPHCLQPLDSGYHGECVHCWALAGEPTAAQRVRCLGTQLGGKYTVGAYLSADGDDLYRGVLNAEKRFCSYQGIFPGHALQRAQRVRSTDV